MDDSKQQLSNLASLVVEQNAIAANVLGQLRVMGCTLAALVRTHPDPEAFAQAFRRAWMQSGVSLEESDTDQEMHGGIEALLEILESNCSVPLNVRPPDVALPPEH